jgi:uncharacterized protein YgiB involved in biofilm formation
MYQMINYKKGRLSPDRIERLEKIGFIWDILKEQYEKGFQETVRYKERTGNSNAPNNYKTAEGYLLGSWQSHQRGNFKNGELSLKRIKRLEGIGFKWEIRKEQIDENFEKGFQETLLYRNKTGNPNAPEIYKTAEGFQLGRWQSHHRKNFKKRILSPERIERLEKIGFIWDILEEWFKTGFKETLHYKNNTGNPNAPVTYKTAEGYMLGKWQSHQRDYYKKGKLSQDRIKRLEEIGFKWSR